MIERRPSWPWVGVWAVLLLANLVAGAMGNGPFAMWVQIATLLTEIVSVLVPSPHRTSLSEISTWYIRQLSKHTRPGVGWNNLLILQASVFFFASYVWLSWAVGPSPDMPLLQLLPVLPTYHFWKGQHDHWLDPPTNG